LKSLLLSLILIFPIISCSKEDLSETQIKTYKQLVSEKKAVGLDVRSSLEIKVFEADGSTHIPIGDLDERAKELDKSKTILIFCESGGRAGAAVRSLKSKGFKNVFNVKDWRTWRKIRLENKSLFNYD
jgi:rhodanese-related sulfurtransferase